MAGNVKANYGEMLDVADKLAKAPETLIPNFQDVINMANKAATDSGSEALAARHAEMVLLLKEKIEPAAEILKNIGKAIEIEVKALQNADRA